MLVKRVAEMGHKGAEEGSSIAKGLHGGEYEGARACLTGAALCTPGDWARCEHST